MKKVIASWGICNTASLNVYEVNDDHIQLGINDNTPIWKDIQYDEEGRPYVNFGGEYYLDECMRI